MSTRAWKAAAFRISDGASPRIVNCRITGNKTHGGQLDIAYGGGILARDDMTNPVIINCVIEGNKSSAYGGGMCSRLDSNPTVISSTFQDNVAGIGGGIACKEHGDMQVTNCLVYSNEAVVDAGWIGANVGNGGGISLDRKGLITVTNCTVVANHADDLGGGYAQFNVSGTDPLVGQIYNSIFWHNDADDGDDQIHVSNGSITVTYTTVQDDFSCTNCSNILDDDPNFVGTGPHPFMLACDSLSINSGSNSLVPADTFDIDAPDINPNPTATGEATPDRRLYPRIAGDPVMGDTVDRGAYETQEDCPANLNNDGFVDVNDLLLLIGAWGCSGSGCDGIDFYPYPCGDAPPSVDVNDLLALIGAWGPCTDPGSGSIPESLDDCYELCEEEEGEAWGDCMEGCIKYLCEIEVLECDD